MPGVQWQPMPDLTTALVAGIGAGSPYVAGAITARRGPLGVKAMYGWNPDRFRRADVPGPTQTEAEQENISLTYDFGSAFQVGVARQHFLQDSADAAVPIRASGNSFFAGGRVREVRLTGGVYDSRSQGTSNLSSYFAVGREVTSWLDAELFLLQSRPSGRASSTTPIMNLRWRLSPRVRLMQQMSMHEHRPTVLFGANLSLRSASSARTIRSSTSRSSRSSRSGARSISPRACSSAAIRRTWAPTCGPMARSTTRPRAARFSTWARSAACSPSSSVRAVGRYVVRGVVRDEEGRTGRGRGVELSGEMAFTNSRGEFFVRVRRPQRYALTIPLEEFLLPGHWEIVSAPSQVMAEPEDRAAGSRSSCGAGDLPRRARIRLPAPADAVPAH